MRKLTCLSVSAVLILSGLIVSDIPVHAYEPPSDIHLTIETKEVDIAEIPENRVIPLNIYTENCPPYMMLVFYLEKDARLEYASRQFAVNATGIPEIGGIGYEYGSGNFPDIIGCDIPAIDGRYIDYNGALVRVNMILPEDVSAGEFYSLNFKRSFTDDIDFEVSIALENDFDAMFGNSCFTQLNGGGIRITQSELSPAPTEEFQSEEPAQETDFLPEKEEEIQQEEIVSSEEIPTEEVQVSPVVSVEEIPEETTAPVSETIALFSDVPEIVTFPTTEQVLENTTSQNSVAENMDIVSGTEIISQTTVTETFPTQSETAVSWQEEQEDSKNPVKQLIFWLGVVALAVVGILAGILLFQKKK